VEVPFGFLSSFATKSVAHRVRRASAVANRARNPPRFGGGGFRAFVTFENLQPVGDISCMVGARLVGKPQIGAQKRRSQFGNKLLGGMGFLAETSFQIAVKSCFRACPMGDFMAQR